MSLPVLNGCVKVPAMKKKGTEKMLSVKEAAKRIGAATSSVRYWLTKGRFPNAQLVQPEYGVPYWLIPESEVESFEKGTPGPKPGAKKKKESGGKKKLLAN